MVMPDIWVIKVLLHHLCVSVYLIVSGRVSQINILEKIMLLTENYERMALFPTHTSVRGGVELICSCIVVC